MHIFSEIFFTFADQSLIGCVQTFTNLMRQNHEILDAIINSLETFITDASVNICVIDIYQLVVERQKTVDQSMIQNILDLLTPIAFTRYNINFNC